MWFFFRSWGSCSTVLSNCSSVFSLTFWNNFHFWSKLHSAKHKHAPVPFPSLLNLLLWLVSSVFSVGSIWCHYSSAIFNYSVTSLSPSPKAFLCVNDLARLSNQIFKGTSFFLLQILSPFNTIIGILHSPVPMVNMSGNDLSVGGRQVWWRHSSYLTIFFIYKIEKWWEVIGLLWKLRH